MANRREINDAKIRTVRRRDWDKVSTSINFPKSAYVSKLSSFLFQLTHKVTLKLTLNASVSIQFVRKPPDIGRITKCKCRECKLCT